MRRYGGVPCSLLCLPDVTLFLVIHYHSMTKNVYFSATMWPSCRVTVGAEQIPRGVGRFLGFWVSRVRPMGFSTPGHFAVTEQRGLEESSVGTYFLRKPPYSAISCCWEIGQGPVPIQDQTQFKELGKVCWGRGLPMLYSNKN